MLCLCVCVIFGVLAKWKTEHGTEHIFFYPYMRHVQTHMNMCMMMIVDSMWIPLRCYDFFFKSSRHFISCAENPLSQSHMLLLTMPMVLPRQMIERAHFFSLSLFSFLFLIVGWIRQNLKGKYSFILWLHNKCTQWVAKVLQTIEPRRIQRIIVIRTQASKWLSCKERLYVLCVDGMRIFHRFPSHGNTILPKMMCQISTI